MRGQHIASAQFRWRIHLMCIVIQTSVLKARQWSYLQMSSIIKCFIQVASKKHVSKTCSARFYNCCFLAVIEYLAIEEKFILVCEGSHCYVYTNV